MPPTADSPSRRPTAVELRARIPGWGADLDPADRPAVPYELPAAENAPLTATPVRQEAARRRERSIERGSLTPVFGTAVSLRGASGVVRRLAYLPFSEARAAHWLLLMGADRIDALEGALISLAHGRRAR